MRIPYTKIGDPARTEYRNLRHNDMAAQDKFSKELQVKQILLEDVSDSVKSTDIEEVKVSLERVNDAVKELELKNGKVMNSMLEEENETIDAV